METTSVYLDTHMNDKSTYYVPATTLTDIQEIKGSKFITTVSRAGDKKMAKEFLASISLHYKDATHNCYAFVAGNPYSTTDIGFGDDGEVPGTAGKPMLSVLQHKKIGEIVVVVTRYFGGIKLGTGGLVRAYTSSVQEALDKVPLEKYQPLITLTISCEYQYENTVRQVLNRFDIRVQETGYDGQVNITIQINENVYNKLTDELISNLRGNLKIVKL